MEELERAKVPPRKICFEITETSALANLGEVLWLMQELGAMGCRFAIDDFGSGHASYGYIETLPVDYLKIDGLFVRDLPDNALHRAIVESVHGIASTLGIKTVAESVETQAIAEIRKKSGTLTAVMAALMGGIGFAGGYGIGYGIGEAKNSRYEPEYPTAVVGAAAGAAVGAIIGSRGQVIYRGR